jgi:hypothetical protein
MHYLLTGKSTTTAFISGDPSPMAKTYKSQNSITSGHHAPRGFKINTRLQKESVWNIEVTNPSHNHGPSLDASAHHHKRDIDEGIYRTDTHYDIKGWCNNRLQMLSRRSGTSQDLAFLRRTSQSPFSQITHIIRFPAEMRIISCHILRKRTLKAVHH